MGMGTGARFLGRGGGVVGVGGGVYYYDYKTWFFFGAP